MSESHGRIALLHATMSVVARGGLRALTYRAIAEAAGVSHGLVRHHFGSRDQLIAAAMEFAISESLRGSNMLGEATSIDEFAAGIETLAARAGDAQAFQYELLLEARRRPELAGFADRHYLAYREAIASQLSRLGVRDPDLTELVWVTLDGLVFAELVTPGDPAPVLRTLRKLIRQAVGSPTKQEGRG